MILCDTEPPFVANTLTMTTIVIGIRPMIGNGDTQAAWHLVMATALLALLPPIAVVALMQRWFVKGLIDGRSDRAWPFSPFSLFLQEIILKPAGEHRCLGSLYVPISMFRSS
jgi:hypothetical protein